MTVYAALSGMVSFLPDGTIYGCNHHFAVMLFGYSQEELLKKVRVVTSSKYRGKGCHAPHAQYHVCLFGKGRQMFWCTSMSVVWYMHVVLTITKTCLEVIQGHY